MFGGDSVIEIGVGGDDDCWAMGGEGAELFKDGEATDIGETDIENGEGELALGEGFDALLA